ncbi:MAG TPA: asparaginase domain-containing protein [Deltaproteobacteria bacterium]|nr:asparaginase domain-containing protein [Deltaproteobacteria bacterium]HPR52483.1 asparaginase domain-containing protein [Deltaproteobacteria bacterium]
MKIKFFAVGGTIDKVYFDQKSTYKVGEPGVYEILNEANVTFEYECESIMHKDSLDMTKKDRQLVYNRIKADENRYIIVTHGTDTMVETAKVLRKIKDKVIVLTGSMQPARFKASDAEFNIGTAVAAVQVMPDGVYIAMNGRIFEPEKVVKNWEQNRFEEI